MLVSGRVYRTQPGQRPSEGEFTKLCGCFSLLRGESPTILMGSPPEFPVSAKTTMIDML